MFISSSRILFLFGLLLAIALVPARAAETLSYTVSYRGWLSAMQPVAIAEAQLVAAPAGGGAMQVSTLSLSSAAHQVVDALYPIRYRLRSWHDAAGPMRAVERFKRTRKVKHDLAWVDRPGDRLHYVRAADGGTAVALPATVRRWVGKTAFGPPAEPAWSVPNGVLDRLGLLQVLRERIPAPGEVMVLPVTDGSKLFRYEVRLEGSETLTVAGRPRPAWRLRVTAAKTDSEGKPTEPGHAPVLVWVSRDRQRVPLRLFMDHSVGAFTVDWVPAGRVVSVALDAPVPPPDAWSDEG